MDVKFDVTIRHEVVFGCLQTAHAHDFLLSIPIDGLSQHMSQLEQCIILRYRLIIFLFPIDEVCPIFRKTWQDTFEENTIHYRKLLGFKYRHDLVRDVLFDIFWWFGVPMKKETPMNFLTEPHQRISAHRPTNILCAGGQEGNMHVWTLQRFLHW